MANRFVFVGMLLLLASDSTVAKSEQIPYEKVRYKNHKAFVEEIRKDLPVGTPEDSVLEYLRGRGIPFSKAVHPDYSVDPPSEEHYVVFLVRRVRSWFILGYTDLSVRIYLSDERCVSRIESKLVSTSW